MNQEASPQEIVRWSRALKYAIVIGTLAALVWLIITAGELVNALIIAGLLAYLLKPLVDAASRIPRVSHELAVLLVYLIFLGTTILVPISIAPSLAERFGRLAGEFENISAETIELASRPIEIAGITLLPEDWFASVAEPIDADLTARLWGGVDLLYGVGSNVIWLLVVVVSVYYLLRDGPRLRNWIIRLLPEPWRGDAADLLHDIDRIWRRYLRGQIILGILVGLATALLLRAVGMREAVVLGVIAGVLDLVPSLGPMVAGAIATIVAFFRGSSSLPLSDFWFSMLVLSLFLLVQQVENIWLRPQIMGQSLRLHPGLVFVGVFGALATFGVLGALVVIPIMGSLAVLGRYAHPRMLGMPPVPLLPQGRRAKRMAIASEAAVASRTGAIEAEAPAVINAPDSLPNSGEVQAGTSPRAD